MARLSHEDRGENNLVQQEFEKFIGYKFKEQAKFETNETPIPKDIERHRNKKLKKTSFKRYLLWYLYKKLVK